MQNKCLADSIVYQATVTTHDNHKANVRWTYGKHLYFFKTRYSNHKASFTNPTKRNATELSKHIWDLKNNNDEYGIKWTILKRAKLYNSASNRCNLCVWEKYFMICQPSISSLSKRNELISSCRHSKKFLLENT